MVHLWGGEGCHDLFSEANLNIISEIFESVSKPNQRLLLKSIRKGILVHTCLGNVWNFDWGYASLHADSFWKSFLVHPDFYWSTSSQENLFNSEIKLAEMIRLSHLFLILSSCWPAQSTYSCSIFFLEIFLFCCYAKVSYQFLISFDHFISKFTIFLS